MREIGQLNSETDARRFADHLLTLGITSKLTPRQGRISVWVHDENRLTQAGDELKAFQDAPHDPRFLEAEKVARKIADEEKRLEKAYRKNLVSMRDRWDGAFWERCPIAFSMILISIGVALATRIGGRHAEILQALLFTPIQFDPVREVWIDEGLRPIARGQLWRLVTPIFIHFGWLHLFLNLMGIRRFGGLVETIKRPRKFLLITLVVAVSSNFAQYLEGYFQNETHSFGGLSGVIFGLFGYAWIKGEVRGDPDMRIGESTILIMVAWFFICLTGLVGPIANSAHGVGLVVGILLALTPL